MTLYEKQRKARSDKHYKQICALAQKNGARRALLINTTQDRTRQRETIRSRDDLYELSTEPEDLRLIYYWQQSPIASSIHVSIHHGVLDEERSGNNTNSSLIEKIIRHNGSMANVIIAPSIMADSSLASTHYSSSFFSSSASTTSASARYIQRNFTNTATATTGGGGGGGGGATTTKKRKTTGMGAETQKKRAKLLKDESQGLVFYQRRHWNSGILVNRGIPASVLLEKMKRENSSLLVYRDIVSDAVFYEAMYRREELDVAYLQRTTLLSLWEWQRKSLEFIKNRELDKDRIGCRGVMLCLDMGLGKTIISLEQILTDNQRCYLQTGHRFNGCTLIICQSPLLVENWIYEAKKNWPSGSFKYHRLFSSGNRRLHRFYVENYCDFLIVTYTTIKLAYTYFIGDERTSLLPDSMDPLLDEEDSPFTDYQQQQQQQQQQQCKTKEMKSNTLEEHIYLSDILYGIEWKRIIADESHLIVNQNTAVFKAVNALKSQIRWSVTGTPIQNREEDVRTSLHFIQMDPVLVETQSLETLLGKVMIHMSKKDLLLSTKENGLPIFMPMTITIKLIEFESFAERMLYYFYATYASRYHKKKKRSLQQPHHFRGDDDDNDNDDDNDDDGDGDGDNQRPKTNRVFTTLFLLIQICIGLPVLKNLVLPRGMLIAKTQHSSLSVKDYREEILEPATTTTATATSLHECQSLGDYAKILHRKTRFDYKSNGPALNLPDGYKLEYHQSISSGVVETEENRITTLLGEKNRDTLIWDPYHLCDRQQQQQQQQQKKRRVEVEESLYERLYRGFVDPNQSLETLVEKEAPTSTEGREECLTILEQISRRTIGPNFMSTKNRHVLRYIQGIPLEDKVIVFSNSIRALKDLALHLENKNIHSIVVSGDTNKTNDSRLSDFSENPRYRVLLLSMKLGSLGLNLIAANHVVFLHEWWNPSLEEQARNRTLRFGQTKPIFIVHFILNRTIELYMANMSYKKRNMTSSIIDTQSFIYRQQVLPPQQAATEKTTTVANDFARQYDYRLYRYTMTQEEM